MRSSFKEVVKTTTLEQDPPNHRKMMVSVCTLFPQPQKMVSLLHSHTFIQQ